MPGSTHNNSHQVPWKSILANHPNSASGLEGNFMLTHTAGASHFFWGGNKHWIQYDTNKLFTIHSARTFSTLNLSIIDRHLFLSSLPEENSMPTRTTWRSHQFEFHPPSPNQSTQPLRTKLDELRFLISAHPQACFQAWALAKLRQLAPLEIWIQQNDEKKLEKVWLPLGLQLRTAPHVWLPLLFDKKSQVSRLSFQQDRELYVYDIP